MELRAPKAYFRLQVLGYMYPDAVGEPYDANWLLVRVDAAGPRGAWSVNDPCLLTHEVDRLADWLEALQGGAAKVRPLGFLEPGLLFRVIQQEGGEAILRVHFGSLVHPHWEAPAATASPDQYLDFPLSGTNLPAAVSSLRGQGKKYPRRYER